MDVHSARSRTASVGDAAHSSADLPVAGFVSFRLGGSDGVSVEAAKWQAAMASLGFAARRIAGEVLDDGRPDDVVVPGLAAYSETVVPVDALEESLDGLDLVIVENMLSLPLNLPGARAVAHALRNHRHVALHHHDLPWQRPEWEHVSELPPRLAGAVHVVINEQSRDQLAERGFEAHLIRNHFDLAPDPGDRAGTRARLGLDAGDVDVLVLHPVRAIARKNVPGALELCGRLARELPAKRIHYWLPGPAEDGYAAALETTVDRARRSIPIHMIREPVDPVADGYAACDLVVFPSTWEGFGNPVVESVAHRKPIAVSRYPVLAELTAMGLEFLDVADAAEVAAVIGGARDLRPVLERNLEVARAHLDLRFLPQRLQAVLRTAGLAVPERETSGA